MSHLIVYKSISLELLLSKSNFRKALGLVLKEVGLLCRTDAQLNLRAKANRQHHIIIYHKWAIGLSREFSKVAKRHMGK